MKDDSVVSQPEHGSQFKAAWKKRYTGVSTDLHMPAQATRLRTQANAEADVRNAPSRAHHQQQHQPQKAQAAHGQDEARDRDVEGGQLARGRGCACESVWTREALESERFMSAHQVGRSVPAISVQASHSLPVSVEAGTHSNFNLLADP